ncbi:SDR family NAD(P)-dependent oxidoreductase [Tistrella mobilis]|uniref:SDR family NAD(P)-dependent oxidoreductase n=1 Tax=Tistrella mobilis TaxID=171437 RepID=UPI003556B1AC
MNRNRDFEGRRILITGGASGIGLATARMIAERGGRAAVLDRDRAALDRLDITGVTGHAADVAETAGVEAAVAAAADEMGGIDGVVCAAGIDHEEPLARITDAAWARSIGVNLTSPMLVMRAALPHLAAAGAASAVFISSAAGLVPLKGRASYCAAKAGVVMLAKSFAMELADQGVRVNAICPGAIDTPLFRTSWEPKPDPEATLAAIRRRYALERIGTPDEIAAAVLWLLGPEAGYVTGVALAVDGGRSFH